jgi:hypothetical protein
MEEMQSEYPDCFDDLLDELIEAILTPPASSVQVIRTWLLEILVRGIVDISTSDFKKLENLSGVNDRRQMLLIRGRLEDKNFFRKHKTAISNFPNFELPCLIWGASCLPKDEYEAWIDHGKASFNHPLGRLFLKWAMKHRAKLVPKLKATTVDLPE